jgi:hypothetical protein
VTASDAREEVEALIRRAATVRDGSGRVRSVIGEAEISAVLAAADRYRDAPPDDDGRTVHLEGLMGADSACRYRWQVPGLLALTGNPAAVTCTRCFKSRRYRDMTERGSHGRSRALDAA